jgi:ribose transport system ATP-binding protein
MTSSPLVRMKGIRKKFGQTEVVSNACLDIFPGEVHVLAGENGAGKSTLIRILAGVYGDWEGEIEYFGKALRLKSTEEARGIGLSVIHQELSLVPGMTLAENLFLGRNPTTFGLVRRREQHQAAFKWLARVGLNANPDDLVERLPLAAQQLLEIGKALSVDARVIVMDEPTSALGSADVERLFSLIDQLRREGRGIVYITHKMEEIERLADRITVLRDGAWIGWA